MRKVQELKAFLIHLRLHYQLFILSGAFLSGVVFAGGAFSSPSHARDLLIQFLSVHVLLFGGVTVYNSFWDKDTGPIGGIQAPPPLASWTLPASWFAQACGLCIAARISLASAAVYAASMLFFWLYSSPGARWKGRPWLSLIAIGLSTGAGGFLLGYLSDGRTAIAPACLAGSLGVACLIVSLFPMSQVFQVEEDVQRRDATFTARYGLRGVRLAYRVLFSLGVLLLSGGLATLDTRLGLAFLVLGSASGLGVWRVIRTLRMAPEEYGKVMGVKYVASGLFAGFVGLILWLQSQGWIRGG